MKSRVWQQQFVMWIVAPWPIESDINEMQRRIWYSQFTLKWFNFSLFLLFSICSAVESSRQCSNQISKPQFIDVGRLYRTGSVIKWKDILRHFDTTQRYNTKKTNSFLSSVKNTAINNNGPNAIRTGHREGVGSLSERWICGEYNGHYIDASASRIFHSDFLIVISVTMCRVSRNRCTYLSFILIFEKKRKTKFNAENSKCRLGGEWLSIWHDKDIYNAFETIYNSNNLNLKPIESRSSHGRDDGGGGSTFFFKLFLFCI